MTLHEDIKLMINRSSLGAPVVRRLRARTAGDITDLIVMRALEKKVTERKESSAGPAAIYLYSSYRCAENACVDRRRIGSYIEGRFLMGRNERHVVPDTDGGWNVVKPGADRASDHKPTQSEAIDRAREIVENTGGGEVVIHRPDGTIRDSDTVAPGNDPNPPRDKK